MYRVILIICFLSFGLLSAAQSENRDSVAVTKVEEALEQIGDAVRTAQNPADLDSILERLRLLKHPDAAGQLSASEASQVNRRIEAALRFVARWQDYLSAARSGNMEEAREILENVSQSDESGLIPRSEILSKINGPPPTQLPTRPAVRDLLNQLKTLDDISGALDTLNKWSDEGHGPAGEIQNAITALTPLDRAYREFKAGLTTNVEGYYLSDSRLSPNYLIPLRSQLLALVLPRYLGLSENQNPKPNEGVHAFLDRVVTGALATQNYMLVARAREIQYLMKYGTLDGQKSQASTYITAHNQEEAGQYALAVASYQKVLAIGTDILPPKIIGQKLAAIQKEHPAEYREGMQQFLAPPAPRQLDPHRQPFDPAFNPSSQSRRNLPVPAVSASPSGAPRK